MTALDRMTIRRYRMLLRDHPHMLRFVPDNIVRAIRAAEEQELLKRESSDRWKTEGF